MDPFALRAHMAREAARRQAMYAYVARRNALAARKAEEERKAEAEEAVS